MCNPMTEDEIKAMPATTADEVIAKLKAIEIGTGIMLGDDHLLADQTLCEFLVALGYQEVAQTYETLDLRWYYV